MGCYIQEHPYCRMCKHVVNICMIYSDFSLNLFWKNWNIEQYKLQVGRNPRYCTMCVGSDTNEVVCSMTWS
jgi:hypothetical protein